MSNVSYIYYKSVLYTTLKNYNNSSCFVISSIHLLHSSETLNDLLLASTIDPRDIFLNILKTYACITANSREMIQTTLDYLVKQFCDSYIIPLSYSYIDFMCYFCIPRIFYLFPYDFDTILGEIFFTEMFIDRYKYSFTKAIQELVKGEYVEECISYYVYFVSRYSTNRVCS